MKNKLPPSVEISNILRVFSSKDLYEHLLEELVSDILYHKEEVRYLTKSLTKDEDIWAKEYEREITRHQKQCELKTQAFESLLETTKVLNKADQAWNPLPKALKKKSPKKSSKTG